MKTVKTTSTYHGSEGREGAYDLFIAENGSECPLVVFVHGYMGYKDWGVWNLMAEAIQTAGFSIAKLNLTHNGTTVDEPTVFADLEAFGNGGYLKELEDITLFLNHLEQEYQFREFILVGHSRGGGIVLLAGKDKRVKQIHCLSPICSIASRFPQGEELENWKTTGVYYRKNGRTGQELPHYYSQYEEFAGNTDLLDIEQACRTVKKPVFVYHGAEDTSVLPEEGKRVAEWSEGVLYCIENTGHTFEASEPWNEPEMPEEMNEVVQLIITNLTEIL